MAWSLESQAANLGHIDELIVDGKHCGCGLGTRLLNEIIACSKAKGLCAGRAGFSLSSKRGAPLLRTAGF
ncbi:MAG: hypothetical protein DMF17_13295 [Verrucomicrobia bacterium]|nr:MAG: hypothetical protein DMF17_13295 [Verrucomicrobiota bacterium]